MNYSNEAEENRTNEVMESLKYLEGLNIKEQLSKLELLTLSIHPKFCYLSAQYPDLREIHREFYKHVLNTINSDNTPNEIRLRYKEMVIFFKTI